MPPSPHTGQLIVFVYVELNHVLICLVEAYVLAAVQRVTSGFAEVLVSMPILPTNHPSPLY